jgi:hypothetical protein
VELLKRSSWCTQGEEGEGEEEEEEGEVESSSRTRSLHHGFQSATTSTLQALVFLKIF